MNLFRLLAYLLILVILVLAATLASMMAAVGGIPSSPDLRPGFVALIVVLLFALLILFFLLCLTRAKDRLRARKNLYRAAHGSDRAAREKAARELSERRDKNQRWLESICDVLVRRKFPRRCLSLPIDMTRLPDPCIYSQFFLMNQGQPVTWDNPNIEVLLAGVPQDTYNLQASKNYQIRVGIENASPFFDAIATQVVVNLLSFGIGATGPQLLHSFAKNVPAATPFPGVPETFPWLSPAVAGHYCIQVLITHPNDINPANNHGWNNTVIHQVAAGQAWSLTIPVWNPAFDGGKRRKRDGADRIELAVDSYRLPVDNLPAADANALFNRQPAVWNASVAPGALVIQPGTAAATNVEFRVQVPANAAAGTRAIFNITGARANGDPVGGVTVHLEVR